MFNRNHLAAFIACAIAPQAAATVFMSEYIEGTSYDKGIEIYNAGNSDVDLSSYQIKVFFNGNSTASTSISLDGTLEAGEFFLYAHSDASFASSAQLTSGASLFNGDDAVVLYNGDTVVDSLGQVGFDPGSEWSVNGVDTQNRGLRRLAVTTDTNISDEFDPSEQWQAFDDEDFSDLLAFNGDGGADDDGGNNGGGNDDEDPGNGETLVCGGSAPAIGELQGSGYVTPYDGQLVEVEGVVTAIVESQSGFYLQDFGDGDITTSDGIFVYTGSASFDLAEGDQIRLSAYAGEYYDNSQLSGINELVHCGSSSLPTPYDVVLPVDDALALEALEGMRVQLSDLTVNEVYNLGRYGEVLLANGRRWIPTQIATPGDESQAIDAQNELNKLLLDDGSTAQNPANVPFPTRGLSADNTLRVGDTVDSAVGVMYYSYSEYRVYPTSDVEFSATNPRTLAPEILTEGNLKVASFNVLNFFNGDGEGGGFPTARGAESAEELSRQSAKLIEAMVALDADIIGVMEIENDGYGELSAIAELTNLLATASGQNWAFIDAGDPIGTDEIAVGLLYRPDVVSPVAEPQILTSENSPIDDDGVALFNDQKNRPALAQQFQLDNEASLVAIVNHLKSKGSACGDGDDDNTTGQGNCNLTRTRAAQALAQWTEQQFAEQAVLIMGDLNAYAKEDPITTLEQAGFQQASEVLGKENSYSYVYSGETGQLDHALVNESLASALIDVTEWHINTDEPKALDYTLSYKSIEQQDLFYAADAYRSSDHDPVVVAFDIAAPDAPPTARFRLLRLGRIFISISRAYDEEDGLRGLQHQWQVNGADAGSYRWVMGRINRRDALEVTFTVTDSAEQSDSLTKLSQR